MLKILQSTNEVKRKLENKLSNVDNINIHNIFTFC